MMASLMFPSVQGPGGSEYLHLVEYNFHCEKVSPNCSLYIYGKHPLRLTITHYLIINA